MPLGRGVANLSRVALLFRVVTLLLRVVGTVAPRLAGRVAFELYRHPLRRHPVRPHEVDAHAAATVESLTVDTPVGRKSVVVYSWGDGERPVLLMHGWESRASRFSAIATALRERGFTPMAFDAPGHGEATSRGSSIPVYAAVAAELQRRHGHFAAVIGHSFGVSGAFYAVKQGVTVDRLVGVAGGCDFDFFAEEFGRRLGLPARVVRDIQRRADRALAAVGDDPARRLSVDDRPELVQVPILLVHDRGDRSVPVGQSEKAAAAYGDRARLVVTEGLGHSRLMHDETVVKEIVEFVAESAAA